MRAISASRFGLMRSLDLPPILLPADVAADGGVDVATHVLFQQQSLLVQSDRGAPHLRDVSIVRWIALFERAAGIAGGESLSGRPRKRDPLPERVAAIVGGRAGAQPPTGIRGERYLDLDHPYA